MDRAAQLQASALMGVLWLMLIAGVALAVLWRTGVARALLPVAAAALLAGAAGYAWQQRASLAGHPVAADARAIEVDPGLVAFRRAIMPGWPGDELILAAADDQLRRGDAGAAAQGMLDATARHPDDAALWAGLGSALAAHDGGQVSPAARFAFSRALQLAPREPGPPFFLGLAFAQSGELAAAKLAWLRVLALAPRDAPYRLDIAERLAMIDQFQAMRAGTPPAR